MDRIRKMIEKIKGKKLIKIFVSNKKMNLVKKLENNILTDNGFFCIINSEK